MKKKLILTIALLFVGVFSFSVNAASQSAFVNGTNYSVTVVSNFYDNDLIGSYFDVSVTVKNLQGEKWVVSSQFPSITFNVPSATQYSVFDPIDCAPVISSYGTVSLNPSGGIVLAPNETVQYHFKFLASGGSSTSSISFGSVPSSTAYSFEDLIVLPADELAYLSQLDSDLAGVISVLTYTGGSPIVSSTPGSYSYWNNNSFDGISTYRMWVTRRYSEPIPITYDFELDSSGDRVYSVSAYRYYFNIVIFNSPDQSYYGSYFHNFDLLPHNVNGVFVQSFVSDLYSGFNISNDHLEFQLKITSGRSTGRIPSSPTYTYVSGYIDSSSGSLTWPTFSFDDVLHGSSLTASPLYYPINEYSILRDIYNAFADSDRSDQNQLSSDITNTSNSIHTQEEQYFSSNAQAIQATGLSNYRFDQNQTGGISAVSNDFTAVFNALGGFNSVFIFSLTLSLALQIFRHHPIVFRAKQVNTAPEVGKGDP